MVLIILKSLQIARRRNAHQEANPDAKIISLGIGDTTEPIPPYIVEGLKKGAEKLGSREGYVGYGPEQGYQPLREAICNRLYKDCGLTAGDIFVSDGSKCDIGRLQMMFGSDISVALQVILFIDFAMQDEYITISKICIIIQYSCCSSGPCLSCIC